MAFFDQVGKKLSQVGQDVAQSTKNFAAINKLNSLIAEEQEKIKGCYSGQLRKFCVKAISVSSK